MTLRSALAARLEGLEKDLTAARAKAEFLETEKVQLISKAGGKG